MQPWRSLDSSPYIAFRRSVNSNKPIQLNAHPTFYVSHVTIRGSVLYNKSLCRIRMISYKTTTVLFDQLVHWCRKRNESISFVHDTIEFIALLLSNEATYKHGPRFTATDVLQIYKLFVAYFVMWFCLLFV